MDTPIAVGSFEIIFQNDKHHGSAQVPRLNLAIKQNQMSGKTDKKFLFEVDLNWLEGDKGILTSKATNGPVFVGLPPEFGGVGNPWSPEHLLLGALTSCFMNTFEVFSKKIRFSFSKFECSAIGQIELIEGKYRFSHIDLYPKVHINDQLDFEKAKQALEKAHHHCIVGNSICAKVIYHSQINVSSLINDKETVPA